MILLLYSISLFIIRLDKKPVNRGGKTALYGGGFKRYFRVGRLQMKRPKCPSAHPGEGRGEEGICVLWNGGGFSVIGRPHGERRVRHFLIWLGEGLADREKMVLSGSSFSRSPQMRVRLPPGERKGPAAQSTAGVKGERGKGPVPFTEREGSPATSRPLEEAGAHCAPFFRMA